MLAYFWHSRNKNYTIPVINILYIWAKDALFFFLFFCLLGGGGTIWKFCIPFTKQILY